MLEIFIKLLPVIGTFVLGIFLRRLRVFDETHAALFLKLVLFVALPAYAFVSVAEIDLKLKYLCLPLVAIGTYLIIWAVSFFIGKRMGLDRRRLGSFVVGSLIVNIAFAIPFILSVYGEEGLAYASLYNLGNGVMTFSFTYFLAVRFGMEGDKKIPWGKIFGLPPVWALFLGLFWNVAHVPMPGALSDWTKMLGTLITPLVMLSLGIYFKPRLQAIRHIIPAMIIRSGVGFIIGITICSIFGWSGTLSKIIVLCSAAPIGYNTLVFSVMENLDMKYAASLVSFSILSGMIYYPLLIWWLG